jgi:hypothetical protein
MNRISEGESGPDLEARVGIEGVPRVDQPQAIENTICSKRQNRRCVSFIVRLSYTGPRRVKLPAELLEAAGVNPGDASRESARLLALELYRENKVSPGGLQNRVRCRSRRSWSSRGSTKRRCTIASRKPRGPREYPPKGIAGRRPGSLQSDRSEGEEGRQRHPRQCR